MRQRRDNRRAAARKRWLSDLGDSALALGTRVQLVVGDAGIGKTTFVEAIRVQAMAQGMLTGMGSASRCFGSSPLSVWSDALEDIHGNADVAEAGLLWDRQSSEPALVRYRRVLQLLEDCAELRPTVLILEDLHEGDSASVDLLGFLSQRASTRPWLVVATARPGHSGLNNWRGGLFHVDGLDTDELIHLASGLGTSLDKDQADSLQARTKGNPLFARRLIEHDSLDVDLAPSLSSLLRTEVAQISVLAQPIVDVASVLGNSASRSHIRDALKLIGVESDAAFAGMGSGVDGVVSVSSDGVEFSHPLMRELMYEAISPHRRRLLHGAVGQVLSTEEADPLVVVGHLRLSDISDHSDTTCDVAIRATRIALASGALAEAVEHAKFAQRLVQDHPSWDKRVEVGLAVVNSLSTAGRTVEAEQEIHAISTIDPNLVCGQVKRDVVREYIRLRWREEPLPSALNPEALVALSTRWLGSSSQLSDIAVHKAALVQAGDISGAAASLIEVAEEAVTSADQCMDPQLRAEAYMARRRALVAHPSRLLERTSDSNRALVLATQLGDRELVGRAQRHAICDALALGDRSKMLSLIERYDEAPTVSLRAHSALRDCGLATLEGRYEEAYEILDSAVEELDSLRVQAPALKFFRAFIALDMGDMFETLRQYESIIATVADPALRSAFAWSAAVQGNAAEAKLHLDEVAADLSSFEANHLWPVIVAVGGEVAAALGHDCCAELLERIEPFAGQCLLPASAAAPWFGPCDRIIGLLRFRLGDTSGALDALHAGLAISTRMQSPPFQARSHMALACVYSHIGDAALSDRHAEQGRAVADSIGMGDVFLDPMPPEKTVEVSKLVKGAAQSNGPQLAVRVASLVHTAPGWTIERDGSRHLLPEMAGLAILYELVSRPGQDIHARDLYAAANQGAAVISRGSAPVLDETARRAYQARHGVLVKELDRAQEDNDLERVSLTQIEIEALETELTAAFGLGNRPRILDDSVDRARINVRRSVVRALSVLEKHDSWLSHHLRTQVRTGRFCCYDPGSHGQVEWRLG